MPELKYLSNFLLLSLCLILNGTLLSAGIVYGRLQAPAASTVEGTDGRLKSLASTVEGTDGRLQSPPALVRVSFPDVQASLPKEISGLEKHQCGSDVEFLASVICEGRRSGTKGYGEAFGYVCRRMSAIDGLSAPEALSFPLSDGVIGHNLAAFLPASEKTGSRNYIVVMASLDGMGTINGSMYPGADSNASGVAAMLGIAGRLAAAPVRPRNVVFVALDGHRHNCSGSQALWDAVSSGKLTDPMTGFPVRASQISLVVNLDIIGSSLSPVVKYNKEYLIALGGAYYSRSLESANKAFGLHLTYDYYGSRDFTRLFYNRTGDHRIFLEHGLRCVVFTSGITMLTNKPEDRPSALACPLLEKRIDFISSWLLSLH
ncbi:MAG: M28 family peptidase [Bacteroidales bacterium]|nr:M28 family peptidase [Bacteroidales bacterium]